MALNRSLDPELTRTRVKATVFCCKVVFHEMIGIACKGSRFFGGSSYRKKIFLY